MYGELIPLGGGDPIPLLKTKLMIGRREKCDIVLRFANVSAHHCEMWLEGGYLFVRDLQSSNGIKINNVRTPEGRLDPGDTLTVAKHSYRVDYSPADLGADGPPPAPDRTREIMSESLLARAGLDSGPGSGPGRGRSDSRRYDPTNMNAGQLKSRK
ncbi:FHA domain-containing protein [Botrimarina hoheduenensis]|uniref:Transcriptional regulatory protein EmbR n=1 Tax=Botrimarina hoheduenensis TaxID=2528000 RepID=A0A5C5WEL0_9BACT|nr:FHA domain-containing protein [Botrimarina hoheduenensis]TWT48509.1 Transcriptional regulatory protein EmbR [Botrimarina hoheduenensis]